MIVWCCCSAGRPEMLVRKTLATLARGNFRGSLYVVVPSDEIAAYTVALKGAPVHCILLHCEKGLTRQRAFFRSQHQENTEIVWVDDDLEAIKIKTPTGLVHCRHLDALADFVFQTMAYRADDCYLAGVYPMANRDWMKATITEGSAYVVGAMYFMRNREELYEPTDDECEDHARQLGELAAGRPVLRFNFIGIQTQYWKNAGGLQDGRTMEKRSAAIDHLVALYPELITRVVRRNGKPDIKYLKKATKWEEAPLPATADPVMSDAPATASADPAEQSAPTAPADQAPE